MKKLNYNIIKLNFSAPLHLNDGRQDAYDESEEILHSDTIKSAIFACARQLFGTAANEDFFDSFTVSSAFPYSNEELFLPKPMVKLDYLEIKNEGKDTRKHLKKLQYIALPIFEKIITGEQLEVSENTFSSNKKFLFSSENKTTSIFKSIVTQRLATAKGDEKDGVPYYVERIYFSDNTGLYFFIDYSDNYINMLKASIKLLGENGIGTDRNVGNGQFSSKWEKVEINTSDKANYNMTLSLYCPQQSELNKTLLQDSSYLLIKRGGYISSPENYDHLTYRKKSIYMFKEAAIFPIEMPIKGKKEDLSPEDVPHPVWRDGHAFVIPVFNKN